MLLVKETVTIKRHRDYDDFLWIPNFVFKCIGYQVIEKAKSHRRRYMENMLFILLLGVHLFDKYFMYKQFIILIRLGDIMNVIRITSYVAYSIDANIKFVALNFNLGRARRMNILLKKAFPKTQEERQMYNVNQHYWYRSTIIVIWIYFIATAAIALAPLLNSIIFFVYDSQYAQNEEAIFLYFKPIPMEYWSDYRTVSRYIFIYVLECAYILFTTITNVGTDLWLIHNVMQICMHLNYIKRVLKQYEPSCQNFHRDCNILAQLIRKHQLMYFLTAELNSMFGISLAFTLLSTTGLLCVMVVQLSIEQLSTFFFILLTFIIIVFMQFALVCKYGEFLINVSQNIALAAYEHKWYNANQAYKKLILILMLRAQKQADIVAKTFQPISMETLKMVVAMTYRVFTVVRTMIN